ncbi:hypothetical protein GBA52_015211 [Prunus armeniaca]|nr:hypothetical protein GBA52_015211 [Prunus armeniaca]
MSNSFPSFLDLNLAPPTQTWGQGVSPGLVALLCFLTRTSDIAIGVARSLVTPRDVCILGTRDDNWLVSDVVALSVQSAASIASVGHLLIAKSHEVQILRAQLVAKQNLVDEYQRDIRRLKKNKAKIVEENQH